MFSLKGTRVVLLAIVLVQCFDYCPSLEVHAIGVCEQVLLSRTRLDRKRIIAPKLLVCCENYEYNVDLDQCLPICSLGCVNGTCTGVDTCTCTAPLTLAGHTCVPSVCSNCEHGNCVAPNNCSCHEGYVMRLNGTCKPICTKECVNGQCTEPNKCKCNDGYKIDPDDAFNCIPICDPECVNGTCIGHNMCICNVGYEKSENNSVCKPSCVGCDFGQCITPNTCWCFEGYERTNSTCKPKCSSCSNGDCVAPERCRSPIVYPLGDEGYIPTCSLPCTNGNCLTPDQCFCNKDFNLTCTVICNHGYCSRPSDCKCKPKKKGQNLVFNESLQLISFV